MDRLKEFLNNAIAVLGMCTILTVVGLVYAAIIILGVQFVMSLP